MPTLVLACSDVNVPFPLFDGKRRRAVRTFEDEIFEGEESDDFEEEERQATKQGWWLGAWETTLESALC